MNKSDLINAVASSTDLSKKAAGQAVEAMLAAISKALHEGDDVALLGFGTFEVRERAERTGRDPRTGDPIDIPATRNPAFKAGKALRDAVRG